MRILKYSILLFCIVFFNTMLFALKHDSLKVIKPPKHYFKTIIYTDFYSTSKRDLASKNYVSKKLKTYKLNQFVLGFNIPVFTKNYFNADSTKISNFHLLFTGNYAVVSPIFSGISNHQLSKTSLGFRMVYNTGKKSIFFTDFSPFLTQDNGYNYTQRLRTSFTIVYNYTVNKNMTFRLGVTRSFNFGNRFLLPYIGFRFGKFDGVNLSIQFPRSASLNIPIGKVVKTSIYTKPQGGVYSFANSDSVYNLNTDRTFNFGRYEFLLGSRIDVSPTKNINFYLSGGISTQNNISMFSESFNRQNKWLLGHFYHEKLTGALFINVGLSIKFGRTRSIYNNYNIYDAIDLNNSSEAGDNNINTGNSEIPNTNQKLKNIKPNDVKDLIETQDLY